MNSGKVLYGSLKEPNIHSVISYFPREGKYYLCVKDDAKLILKFLLDAGKEILYCEDENAVGLELDRWNDYIAKTPRFVRAIHLGNLTGNLLVDEHAIDALKHAVELLPAKKIGSDEFQKIYDEEKITAFVLDSKLC